MKSQFDIHNFSRMYTKTQNHIHSFFVSFVFSVAKNKEGVSL